QLTISTSTAPQISLSAGGGLAQWAFRNAGGNFYLGTTTVDGTATTSVSALTITSGGVISISTSTAGCLNTNTSGLIYAATCSSGSGYNLVQDEGIAQTVRTTLNFVGGGVVASDIGGVTTVTISGTSFTGSANSIITTDNSGNLMATGTQLTVGNLIATTTATSFFLGKVGIGTTTPYYSLTVSSTTGSQLALSAGGGLAQWAFRNAGGNFYLGTTTVAGTATTSISALEISGSGFGTTTLRGLNISGQATSTSNVGFNTTGGCYAISDTCLSSGSSFTNTIANGGTGSTQFAPNS